MKEKVIEFYLDWANNYLTHNYMANSYGMEERDCTTLINMGRYYHEQNVEKLNQLNN